MLRLKMTLVLVWAVGLLGFSQKIAPYYNCGSVAGTIATVKENVVTALAAKGFTVIGGYNVSSKSNLYVLAVSSKELQAVCLKVKEKGILASNLRIGFEQKGTNVEITILNPRYLFLGYLRKSYDTNKAALDKIDTDFKTVMKAVANVQTPFGGEVAESELKNYHYMAMMPYFEDDIELKSFDTYEQAIAAIDKNLNAKAGGCKKVYKLAFNSQKMAVYGIALHDKELGEPHIMPIIGEKHFVAMPYEIVVMNNKVYMLHGKFRFAMYWPALTMGTFTKIMSTPGDVEDTFELLVK
jgi:hypothetical protein